MSNLRRRVTSSTTSAALVLLALAVGALVLAGCSSSPHANATSTTTTTSVASSTSSSSTSTTTAAAACSPGVIGLAVSLVGTEAGTSSYAITATNNGPDPCSIDGYPDVAFFGTSGAGGAGAGPKLPISGVDSGPAPTSVTVAPKSSAQFRLTITDVPVNGAGCSTVASIDVTLPNSTEALPVAESLQPCGATVDVTAFGPPGSAQA